MENASSPVPSMAQMTNLRLQRDLQKAKSGAHVGVGGYPEVVGTSRLQCRPSMREGLLDRLRQVGSIEIELAREQPEIEEVLHPAVQGSEVDHSFELLGHDGLSRIHAEPRCRELEEGRVGPNFRARMNNVAEADVELHGQTSSLEKPSERDPDAHVVRVLLDPLARNGSAIELEAVIGHDGRADLSHDAFNDADLVFDVAEQIDVACRA
jgi:hypothetical protein